MNELISVVVPIYNVEKYLKKCVDSLLEQSYKNLEIVLVDDGSTDRSSDICDEYACKYERVKVIHQSNQGLAGARNTGLKNISGKYVGFVDSDDWVDKDMYAILYQSLIENDCDISTCGRVIVDDKNGFKKLFCQEFIEVLSTKNAVKSYLLQDKMNMSACDKLFKVSLFEGVEFPLYYVSEDILPIYLVLNKSKKIILTGKPLYYYFQRRGSLSHSVFNEKSIGTYLYSKQVSTLVKKEYPDLVQEADFFQYTNLLYIWRLISLSNSISIDVTELKEELKIKKIIFNKYTNIYYKVYSCLMIIKLDKFFLKIIIKLGIYNPNV